MKYTALILSLFLSAAVAAQSRGTQVFKWVDRNGVTHYADKPNSPQAVRGVDVKVKQPLNAEAQTPTPSEPKPSVAQNDPTKNWESDENGNKIPPNRTSACEVAQKNLHVLNDQSQIALQNDAQGNPTVLEGAAKQNALKRAQDDINLFCAPQ